MGDLLRGLGEKRGLNINVCIVMNILKKETISSSESNQDSP